MEQMIDLTGHPADELTVEQLKRQAAELLEAKAMLDEAKEQEKQLSAIYTSHKIRMLNALEAAGLETFIGDDCRVTVLRKTSVKVPKTEAEKREFFKWCEERGIFWEIVSVSSQSLNRFYKEESELALQRGEIEPPQIPGLQPPTEYNDLQLRRKG